MTEQSNHPEDGTPQTDEERRRKQLEILDLFGTIDFDPAYDYKKARWRRKAEIIDEEA